MLLTILLPNFVLLSLTDAGPADAKSSPKLGSEGLENLVEKLELRLRDMETKFEEMEKWTKHKEEEQAEENKKLKAKNKEMETRLQELEEKTEKEKDETEKREKGSKASTSKLRMEVEEESSRKEIASNISNNDALTNPSLRDLPIVIISAWRAGTIISPQTVTFESFLANYNNGNRPGGGDGELDLDSGVFTCFTPGYYQVSFSAEGIVGPDRRFADMSLYKNGFTRLRESLWHIGIASGALNDNVAMVGSRILILHLDAGDTLELGVEYVYNIS